MRPSNKPHLYILILIILTLAACSRSSEESIRVGILHSLTGTMAVSESPVVDATLMAIEEINLAGGVQGRQIEPIVVDTRSDAQFAAEEAERLIIDEDIQTIFGCWTSACRRTVRPIIEKHDALLFYPVQYEGLENSPNIVYTGMTPNQQITIAAQWAYRFIGDRFYLVGSDYIYPHAANEIVKDKIHELGGEIIGERYIKLGDTDVASVVQHIIDTKPDVILSTINGDTNFAFFQSLRAAGITSGQIPTISFSLSEQEVQTTEISDFVGDYAVWSYYQSIESPINTTFVENYQDQFGLNRPTSDPIEAAYNSVYLWKSAVELAQSFAAQDVKDSIGGIIFSSPQGILRVDEENLHFWKQARIGKINENGNFDIVWETSARIRPEPYPRTRTIEEWDAFVLNLYNTWDQNWENKD